MKKLIVLFFISLMIAGCGKDKDTSIEYPETGRWGENMLFQEKYVYSADPETYNSLYAILGKDAKLKIECINWSGFPNHEDSGWDYYMDFEAGCYVVETYRTGKVDRRVSLKIDDVSKPAYIFYYENNDTVPSFYKVVLPDYD